MGTKTMILNLKSAVVAATVLGASALGVGTASAMPIAGGLDPAVAVNSDLAPLVQDVRWACGPYGRCRWVPNRGFYGPRPFYGPRRFYGGPRFYRRRFF
jgi:hypothetical protein